MDEVVNDDLTVAHIYRTTWQELTDRELVTARDGIGCCRYQLTGSGWREALKITGQLDAPEFQERFGRLNTVLERLVNGRKEEGSAQTHIVAAQARVPESWLFNMLESPASHAGGQMRTTDTSSARTAKPGPHGLRPFRDCQL